jgi:hypothetical protein
MSRVALPRLSFIERAGLWLRYQAYGLVLVGGGAAALSLAAAHAPLWVAIPVAALALAPVGFGITVLRRWPRKLRATRIAQRRIDSGRFTPSSVRSFCGDPCFRVVAREILRRAGLGRAERRALVAGWALELRRSGEFLILVDRDRGTVFTMAADGVVRSQPLAESQQLERI